MIAKTLVLLTSLMSLHAMAFTQPPVTVPLEANDRIRIEGNFISAKLVPTVETKFLKVFIKSKSGKQIPNSWTDGWSIQVRRDGGEVVIQEQSPLSKNEWPVAVKKRGFPEFELLIQAPPMPVVYSASEGEFSVSDWQKPLQISLGIGDVVLKNITDVSMDLRKGKAVLAKGNGRLQVQQFEGSLVLTDWTGEVKLHTHSVAVKSDDIEGRVAIEAFDRKQDWSNVDGPVRVDSKKGIFNFASLRGELTGQLGEGSIKADFSGPVAVNLQSENAKVDLIPGKQSAASVNVGSQKGALRVPAGFLSEQIGDTHVRKGQLQGSQGGRIFVRSEGGGIFIR